MAEPVQVFQFVFEDVLPVLDTFVTRTSSSMAALAGAAGGSLFAIYVLFWGLAIVTGQIQEPMTDGVKRIARAVVILAFATSAGIYGDWVIGFFTQVPGAIAAEVAQAGASGGFAMTPDLGTAQMLDATLAHGLKAAQSAWERASTFNVFAAVTYGTIAILICIFTALVCAYAGALVLMAHLGLSIMLGIGPLFIIMAMFEATQQLFVAWSRQLITFAVFFIVLAAAVTLTFSFFAPFIEHLGAAPDGLSGVSEIVKSFMLLVCMCTLALFVLWQSQSWASGLAGGVSVAAAGAIGRAVMGATHGAAHRHYDPMKVNKDGSQGGHRWVGAIPSAARAVAATAQLSTKGAAYMRRNQIKRG